jgi:AraC-like DNA-binding protein
VGLFVTALESPPDGRQQAVDWRTSAGVAALLPAAWKPFLRQLSEASQRFDLGPPWWAANSGFFAAVETRAAGSSYRWDGIKRFGKGDCPFFVCQLTIGGWGHFELYGEAPRRMTPGTAFCVTVPSRHRYYLPPDSPGWTFCWIEISHPYVVERAKRQVVRRGPIVELKPESALVTSAARLVRGTFKKDFHDRFEVELALFDFMLAYERSAQVDDPDGEREGLLEAVRQRVLAHPRRSFKIDALAADYGMSRSHFSRFFRARTSLTPARFVTEVRLREAARLLVETRFPLKQIADRCGFANVNHFGKVFRRFHQQSPGSFRGRLV